MISRFNISYPIGRSKYNILIGAKYNIYEKTANEYWKSKDKTNRAGGYVCSVSIKTKEEFAETEEHFRTTEGIDVYTEGFGHFVVLGTDAAYVYNIE